MSGREIVCEDLNLAIDGLRSEGYRLDCIYPADDPTAAVLSKSGEAVRLFTTDAPALTDGLPPFAPKSVLTCARAAPLEGRAGMFYRDLIPGRLGGRYIASHISILGGGPVDDWVHYHRIALQIIAVRRGWVRVVYEDQGEPFVMNEGDLVLQPPEIRHRVLESSDGLEVVEIGAPALHATFSDHELALPNGKNADRRFAHQRFVRHIAVETPWTRFGDALAQETEISDATGGLAQVRTIRRGAVPTITFPAHEGELVFGFLLEGGARLSDTSLEAADSFVVPPGQEWLLSDVSEDFRLLHVTTGFLA